MYIDILRHANAAKITDIQELYRPLSEQGIQQALALRTFYGNSADNIARVIHSPAPRASCTAAIAVGKARPTFICLPSLWVEPGEPDGPLLWRAFEQYGYDLEKYFQDQPALETLHRFGERTSLHIRIMLERIIQNEGDIWIVAGHAIFSNFTAYYLSNKKREDLLKIRFAEAQLVRLVFDDDVCTGLIF